MFKKYLEAMEYININHIPYIDSCDHIIYMVLEKRLSKREIGQINVVDTIVTAEKINLVMHDVIMKKINVNFTEEVIEEKSAFDDYDRENGYIDDEPHESMWISCIRLVNSLVRMAIKVFNDSFSSILKADIVELIEQIRYELDALENEKRNGVNPINGRG